MTTTNNLNNTMRFPNRRKTYKEWKVDYDPLSDECIARDRTFKLLLAVSELKEYSGWDLSKHEPIKELIKSGFDHVTFFSYGVIPVVMIEPYGTTEYEFSGLELLKLHKEISPYGVCNGYETQSILCVKQINRKVLLEIRDKIEASLVHLPERNVVTQDERDAAKLANPTAVLRAW